MKIEIDEEELALLRAAFANAQKLIEIQKEYENSLEAQLAQLDLHFAATLIARQATNGN